MCSFSQLWQRELFVGQKGAILFGNFGKNLRKLEMARKRLREIGYCGAADFDGIPNSVNG
jgi:hypothetical protein